MVCVLFCFYVLSVLRLPGGDAHVIVKDSGLGLALTVLLFDFIYVCFLSFFFVCFCLLLRIFLILATVVYFVA